MPLTNDMSRLDGAEKRFHASTRRRFDLIFDQFSLLPVALSVPDVVVSEALLVWSGGR